MALKLPSDVWGMVVAVVLCMLWSCAARRVVRQHGEPSEDHSLHLNHSTASAGPCSNAEGEGYSV